MTESRTRNATRNAVAGIINRVVGLLIPFILRTAIIKILGEEYLGLSNLFSSILQVLSLADLGFSSAIVYSMYKPIAERNHDAICALLSIYKKIYITIGSIVLIVGLAIIPWLDKLIRGGYPEGINITILYLMYLFNTVCSYMFFADRKALLSAHQRSDIENNINSVVQIIFDVLKLGLLFLLKNYYIYVLLLPMATFFSGLITAIYSYKKYPQYHAKGNIDHETRQGIIKRVTALTIQRFGNTISTSLDSIVVSAFLGLTAVAIYGNYFYIVSSLMSFISVCISATTAGIGNSLVTETTEKNYYTFKKINMLNQWTIIWCVPCLICLYQHFMNLWVGSKLMMNSAFVWLMVAYFYVAESRKVVQVFKDAAGMWWADKWKPLVGCTVNFVFNIIAVQFIGMHGVILSTIISYLFVEIPWETIVLFKQYFKGYLKDYIIDLASYLICIIFSVCISLAFIRLVNGAGIITFIVKGFLCFIISNLVFVVMFHKTNSFRELLGMIIKGR